MSTNIPAIDILVYIALKEEFDTFMEMLGKDFRPKELEGVAITCFFGSIASSRLSQDFQIAVVPAGKMGNIRSANIVSTVIDKLNPANVVVLGIAGSLTNDLEPGDVFVPDSVNEYLANSASRGEAQEWSFQTSGNHFQSSVKLLNRLQFFEHTQSSHYSKWQHDAAEFRNKLIEKSIQDAMSSAGLAVRVKCKLFVGDDRKLASGPAVGKGKAFLEWLTREVDRKVVALEMESAGVYDAAIIRTPAPRTIAIRGISDFADERKEKIETNAKGRFRELAAKNAVALLLRAIEAGLFQQEEVPPRKPARTFWIWSLLVAVLFLVLAVQTITGKLGEAKVIAWTWYFLVLLMPLLAVLWRYATSRFLICINIINSFVSAVAIVTEPILEEDSQAILKSMLVFQVPLLVIQGFWMSYLEIRSCLFCLPPCRSDNLENDAGK